MLLLITLCTNNLNDLIINGKNDIGEECFERNKKIRNRRVPGLGKEVVQKGISLVWSIISA